MEADILRLILLIAGLALLIVGLEIRLYFKPQARAERYLHLVIALVLLAIAETFASQPTAPARSLLFLFVDAEEQGLLGSRAYVEQNPELLERVARGELFSLGQHYIALSAMIEAHQPNQRFGQPGRLVGHDAPGNRAPVEVVEQLGDAVEQGRVPAEVVLVDVQQKLAAFLEAFLAGLHAETETDQGGAAMGDDRADMLVGQLLPAERRQCFVQCEGEVRGRVGEGTVEIEQQAADYRRAWLRHPSGS